MTRPKVNPENRQRTANACDSCKRRKQKASTPYHNEDTPIDAKFLINRYLN